MADLTKSGYRPLQMALRKHAQQRPYPYEKQYQQKNNCRGPKTRAECINNLRKKINNLKA